MTNKSTHWVTIPEETVHTPASNPSKKTGKMSKTGKAFWGIGFVIVVVITAALVAPKQMANLLQGNLFEQSGIAPLEVIPSDEPAADETVTEETVSEEVVPEVAEPTDVTVVEPETEAVTVQVEPVVTEEPTSEEPAEGTVAEDETAPTEVVTETIEIPGAIKEELDANKKLLEELSGQVAEFKEKDEEKTKIIEDLAGMVAEETLKPAAETLPPAVTTTTALGQVPTGYRVNTHIVTMSPYETLQKNTAFMEAKQTGAYASTTAQQDYSAQLARAQGTPDSGPKEILLIALALTFAAMLGWKISKLAKAN